MDSYMTIEQFARDLILDVLDLIPKDLLPQIEELPIRKYMNRVVPAVEHFTDEFFREFEAVFNISYNCIKDSEADFVQYVNSCCSNLRGDCTYLHFLLVCAFILELLNYSTYKRQCFRFMETASVSLVDIFNEHFKANFFDQGGWFGFKAFCDIVTRSRYEDDWLTTLTGNSESKENLFHLIAECANKPNSDLAKYEHAEQVVPDFFNKSQPDTSVKIPESTAQIRKVTPERKKQLTLPLFSFNAPQSSSKNYPTFSEASCSSSCNVESDNSSIPSNVVVQFAKSTTAASKTNFTLPVPRHQEINTSIQENAFSGASWTSPPSLSKNVTKNIDYGGLKCMWCGCKCFYFIKMCQERYKEKHLQFIREEAKKDDSN